MSTEVVIGVRIITDLNEFSKRDIRLQLQRILASDHFVASPQLATFLNYVVSRTIQGDSSNIKAYTIAVEAFEKPPSFDPASDSSIRGYASRLRNALKAYYLVEGLNDPVIIDLPKGKYIPSFTYNEQAFNQDLCLDPTEKAPRLAEEQTVARQKNKAKQGWYKNVAKLFPLVAAALLAIVLVSSNTLNELTVSSKLNNAEVNSVGFISIPSSQVDKIHSNLAYRLNKDLVYSLSLSNFLSIIPVENHVEIDGITAAELAKKLNVSFLVSGVLKHDLTTNKYILYLSLLDGKTGSTLWTEMYHFDLNLPKENYDKALENSLYDFLAAYHFEAKRVLANRQGKALSPIEVFELTHETPGSETHNLKQYKKEITLTENMLKATPSSGPLHALLAHRIAYLTMADPPSNSTANRQAVIEHSLKALETAGGHADSLLNVAFAYYFTGEIEKSISMFERVLELDANHLPARLYATALPYTCNIPPMKVIDDLITLYSQLNSRNPAREMTAFLVGMLFYNIKDYQNALNWIRLGTLTVRKPARAYLAAAILYKNEYREEAKNIVREIKQSWPNSDPQYHGEIYAKLGQCEKRKGPTHIYDGYIELATALKE